MLVLELRFTPDPARLAARPAHRDRLVRLHSDDILLAAGPWADDSGALLVFDTTRDRLDAIMADDPYYRTPGVEVVGVREWTPVVAPRAP
ncbi:YciI family protein [Streptomyces sp. 184]|uniref:YciI family protein n=1 Tax=Streptomyces sp. 184 TaxID=1827526 RepID=UPI0038925F0A